MSVKGYYCAKLDSGFQKDETSLGKYIQYTYSYGKVDVVPLGILLSKAFI